MKDYEIPNPKSMRIVDMHRVISAINDGSDCQWRDDGDKVIIRTRKTLPLEFVELPSVQEGEVRIFKLKTSTSVQKKGKRTPLQSGDHEARKRWLGIRSERFGFEVISAHCTDELVQVEKIRGKPFFMDSTTFVGTLRVTNLGLFNQALEKGLTGGKGTAYGFGLLTI